MTGYLIRNTSTSPKVLGSFGLGLVPQQQQQVAKSFYCVFCRDIASLRMGDFAQFQQHMENVHRVHYEYDILLAVNFIERAEKDAIIEKVKRKVGGGDEEVVTEKKKKVEIKMSPPNTDIKPAKTYLQSKLSDPFSKVTIEKITNRIEPSIQTNNREIFLKQEPQWENPKQANLSFEKILNKPISSPPGPINTKLQIIRIKSDNPNMDSKNFLPTKAKMIMIKSEEEKPSNTETGGSKLSCKKCKKKFPQMRKLRMHEAKKNDCEKVCGKCKREFAMPGLLRQHMKMTKPCVSPKCNLCGKSFGSEKLFWHHKNKRSSCVPLKCEDCPMEFTSKKLFQLHKERRKTCKKQTLTCENCNKWFSSTRALHSHKNKEIPCKKKISCEKCGKVVKESKFENHSCKAPVDRKCKNCLRTFGTKGSARQHYKRQVINPSACRKRLECEKCGRRLREELFEKHILRSCVLQPCERCGERFTEAKLKKHKERKRTCHPRTDQSTFTIASSETSSQQPSIKSSINCDICDEEVASLTGLKNHIQKMHKKDIVCVGCNKTFGCDKDLIFHKKRKRDCPEFNPDLQYVPVMKNLESSEVKNLIKTESFEEKIFKSESLEENVEAMDVAVESTNCWGCHKVIVILVIIIVTR